jgi:hypothetical protein
MEKFNISKWKNKYILKEETTSADVAQTFSKTYIFIYSRFRKISK